MTAAASKKTVREMFLYAGLCHLCSVGGNGGVVKEALKRFQVRKRISKESQLPGACFRARFGSDLCMPMPDCEPFPLVFDGCRKSTQTFRAAVKVKSFL